MRTLLLSLLLIVLPAFGADRAAVVNLLNGYEYRPDKAALDRLGPNVYRALLDLAGDDAATNLMRGRAMAALTLYPNDEVWAWFVSATKDVRHPVLRRRAVDAMCKGFAAQRGDALVSALAPLLQATDAHLRVSTARCLREIGGRNADAALSAYRKTIHQPWEARAAGFKGANTP